MKKFLFLFSAVFLSLFTLMQVVDAATIKRPLTVKQYKDQYYYEWTGSAVVTTNDKLIFYADTAAANLYANDPAYLMFTDKSATAGFNPWIHWPNQVPPDSVCVALSVTGDGDASTADVYLSQGATRTATMLKTGPPTAKTHTSTASTTDLQIIKLSIAPMLFWTLTHTVTTSTDTETVIGARVYPCSGG